MASFEHPRPQPRILAENAGHNHVDAITALYAAHQKGEKAMGIDVDGPLICNAAEKGILDHCETKRPAACGARRTVFWGHDLLYPAFKRVKRGP